VGWRPDQVEVGAVEGVEHRPFEPVTLAPGEGVSLAISGPLDRGGRGGTDGLTSYGTVPVRWRLAGVLPRTSDVHPGYTFGWSSQTDAFLQDLVDWIPPSEGS
jgi:hypothetical protein